MNLKCLLGFHDWKKYMGPSSAGRGKVMQRYKCQRCGKIKKITE